MTSIRKIKAMNQIINPFNYVRIFYQFGGVFLTKRCHQANSRVSPSFWKTINAIILLFVVIMSASVIITVYAHFFTDKYDPRLSVVFIALTLSACVHRIYLSTVIDGWLLLPKKLSCLRRKLHLQVQFTSLSWIIFWAATNAITNFVAVILIVDAYATPGSILFLTFEIKNVNGTFVKIVNKLFSMSGYFLLLLPTIGSGFYYILICQQVKSIIEGFRKQLKSQKFSCQRLANAYNEIRDIVNLVDHETRFYTFNSITYYALMM